MYVWLDHPPGPHVHLIEAADLSEVRPGYGCLLLLKTREDCCGALESVSRVGTRAPLATAQPEIPADGVVIALSSERSGFAYMTVHTVLP